MKTAIFLCRWGLVIFSMIWSLSVLPAEYTRIHYADFNERIAEGEQIELAEFSDAIDVHSTISSLGFCMPGVREQLAFLLSRRSDLHLGDDALEQTGSDLDRADNALRKVLACSPYESNQWLTLAMLDITRKGVVDNNFLFLNLSYLTGPRERWIVERRMTFAVGIAPIIPASLLPLVRKDIAEIRSVESLKKRFLERMGIETIDDLEGLFG